MSISKLKAVASDSGTISLSWTGSGSAVEIVALWRAHGSTNWTGVGLSKTTTAHTITGLTAGQEYDVRVLQDAADQNITVTVPQPVPAPKGFYVYPQSSPVLEVAALRAGGDTTNAATLERIASQPIAVWLDQDSDASRVAPIVAAAKAANQIPVFTVYNIPNRDNGGASSGGSANVATYEAFINAVAAGLGAGSDAWVVLEPDALDDDAVKANTTTIPCLQYAYKTLKATGAKVYVDAGNPGWESVGSIAALLNQVGEQVSFAVNVSNFYPTDACVSYGERISAVVDGARFVIDTSRNGGTVAAGEWENPAGALLGENPTTNTSNPLVDAFLWVKIVGESDGPATSTSLPNPPPAGTFWLPYALMLCGATPPPPPPPPTGAITVDQIGATMPGDVTGYKVALATDFDVDVPLGGFSNCVVGNTLMDSNCNGLPAAVADLLFCYPDGWPDTTGNGVYAPAQVLSIHDSVLDLHLRTAEYTGPAGTKARTGETMPLVAAIEPKIPGGVNGWGLSAGVYAIRFISDNLPGYGGNPLLWPDSEVWPRDGEIDYPNGDLGYGDGASVFMHRQNGTSAGDQDYYPSGQTYQAYHTWVMEWRPDLGYCRFYVDGKLVGDSTARVPNTPMHWVLQFETSLSAPPAAGVSGHVLIDWIAVYAPAA